MAGAKPRPGEALAGGPGRGEPLAGGPGRGEPWRTKPLRDKPLRSDLSEANLGEADLRDADLSGANLRGSNTSGANTSGANLSEAKLSGANTSGANLSEAKLSEAKLSGANLFRSNLSGASLHEADLRDADLSRADLSGSNLSGAILGETSLRSANLSGADLPGADLEQVTLLGTNLTATNLMGCHVYGISAWNLKLEGAKQRDLVITRHDEPQITVDNLEVAQFIYLLLHNEKVRSIIDTVTSKVVLILGRFTPDRKAVLDALREELRKRNYLPILFDFDKPASRDITETVSLLARMARFVVADITEARSIPQELMVIAPDLPSVPIQPLLQEGAGEYGMFEHFRRYPWVLKEHVYASPQQLIAELSERVIGPAEAKVRELRG